VTSGFERSDSCNLNGIVRWAPALLLPLLTLAGTRAAQGAETPAERRLTTGEIEQWLDQPSGAVPADSATPGPEEAPPPPPHRHGVTIESSIGALTYLGPLQHITPTSPWFHLKLGFEPWRWLLVFAETDQVFSTTSYAHPPPPPRTYRMYGFGGGLRFTVKFIERLGGYVEGSGGIAEASTDVLEVYGYTHATEWSPYFGGRLGLEWYPVNPHLAVSAHGGVRSYQAGLKREQSQELALAVLGGLALRYTF
jgi:hypothetical protein